MRILAINPGGGTTKVAVFDNTRPVFRESIEHPAPQLVRFGHVLDQYSMRKDTVLSALKAHKVAPESIGAIASRGGPLMPLPGGVFRINARVVGDIQRGCYQTLHPSLLGPLISHELSRELDIPAYFVDPESTDEFRPEARFAGLKGIERAALSHALSCRTVAQEAARRLHKRYENCRFVVAHIGTGITVAAHVNGRQVDASNANDDGPFTPQRTGSLPLSGIIRVCFSGRHTEAEVLDICQRRGGLLSYLGTDDIRKVEAWVRAGDKRARLTYDALVYGIAKEIGAHAVACGGKVDALVLTGGLTLSKGFVAALRRWVKPLFGRIIVFPGEEEMSALAARVLAVMTGKEKEKDYAKEVTVRG
ncbi:MAG: butyrate kinase [bacterium]